MTLHNAVGNGVSDFAKPLGNFLASPLNLLLIRFQFLQRLIDRLRVQF